MKILIAPNSLKGCADSVSVAEVFAANLFKLGYTNLLTKPVSDGGDGFLSVCEKYFSLKKIKYKIPSPDKLGKIDCSIGYNKNNKTIYIESAKVLGLSLIPQNKRHPLNLSSEGMGILLKKILEDVEKNKIEVEKVKIGVGGTGTNDMGIGMAAVLGLKLLDNNDNLIDALPKNFNKVKKIRWGKIKLPFKVEVIADVTNPLLGKAGASEVFGRQKGLTNKEIKISEDGFKKIVRILRKEKIIKNQKFLSGAGGGIATGFELFLKAKIVQSDQFILKELGLRDEKKISFVITAEGAFDRQSFMNKATGTIIKEFTRRAEKIFLVCGTIENRIKNRLPANVYLIELSKYFNNKSESIRYYKKGINLACKEIIENLYY